MCWNFLQSHDLRLTTSDCKLLTAAPNPFRLPIDHSSLTFPSYSSFQPMGFKSKRFTLRGWLIILHVAYKRKKNRLMVEIKGDPMVDLGSRKYLPPPYIHHNSVYSLPDFSLLLPPIALSIKTPFKPLVLQYHFLQSLSESIYLTLASILPPPPSPPTFWEKRISLKSLPTIEPMVY